MATEAEVKPYTVGDAKKQLRAFTANHELYVRLDGELYPIDSIHWGSGEMCVVAEVKL